MVGVPRAVEGTVQVVGHQEDEVEQRHDRRHVETGVHDRRVDRYRGGQQGVAAGGALDGVQLIAELLQQQWVIGLVGGRPRDAWRGRNARHLPVDVDAVDEPSSHARAADVGELAGWQIAADEQVDARGDEGAPQFGGGRGLRKAVGVGGATQ